MERELILIAGQVQGVGFRSLCGQYAWIHHLTGRVRNLSNGNVELQLQGNPKDIDACLDILIKGTRTVHITDYSRRTIPVIDGEKGFLAIR